MNKSCSIIIAWEELVIGVHSQTRRNNCIQLQDIRITYFVSSWSKNCPENMLKTTCRNALKRLRIACTACVLWIDGIEVGTWLCICKGGSSIGILLKIRCKTKCDKTLPARKVYMQNKENTGLITCIYASWRFNASSYYVHLSCRKDSMWNSSLQCIFWFLQTKT